MYGFAVGRILSHMQLFTTPTSTHLLRPRVFYLRSGWYWSFVSVLVETLTWEDDFYYADIL
jgi:hypothetical protein